MHKSDAANMNIILVCQPARIHTDALMHKLFYWFTETLGEHRATRSKANLYIIRRRLYRMADLTEAAPGVGSFNYSHPSAIQFADTGNVRSSAVNHAGVSNHSARKKLSWPNKQFGLKVILIKTNV